MGRHQRERRRAPSLPRCCECQKAVSACLGCQPGGFHMRLGERLLHVHARCALRFSAYHAREGEAHAERRRSRRQRREALASNGVAGFSRGSS